MQTKHHFWSSLACFVTMILAITGMKVIGDYVHAAGLARGVYTIFKSELVWVISRTIKFAFTGLIIWILWRLHRAEEVIPRRAHNAPARRPSALGPIDKLARWLFGISVFFLVLFVAAIVEYSDTGSVTWILKEIDGWYWTVVFWVTVIYGLYLLLHGLRVFGPHLFHHVRIRIRLWSRSLRHHRRARRATPPPPTI